ncbi:MAG TPA: hypothetical protein VG734_25820 [Lacunisphaera sp.]|nr:hypothetical protein [Lacunisphaera sp.]
MSFRKLASKDPDAVVPYQIDLTAYLTAVGDTLESVEFSVMDAASAVEDGAATLSIVSHTQTADGIVTFWVAGGTTGVEYTVRCRFTGANTNPVQSHDDISVVIPVRQT